MKKRVWAWSASLFLVLTLCAGVLAYAAGAKQDDTRGNTERIPFELPTLKANSMPPVFFAHDKHIAAVEAAGKDCAACHQDSPQYFMDSEKKAPNKVVAYVHQQCVECHAGVKSGKPTGPQLASCRSCHSETVAKNMAKSGKKGS